jgi:uncharacterized protein
VVNFEDLSEGMLIKGKIKNVVDFGAFVDLGIKETALAHISELSDHFVKDPLDAVKVGEVLEFRIIGLDLDRRRISLSRKSDSSKARSQPPREERKAKIAAGDPAGDKMKRVAAVKKTGTAGSGRGDNSFARDNGYGGDDGSMYNPFTEAFKNMKKKK